MTAESIAGDAMPHTGGGGGGGGGGESVKAVSQKVFLESSPTSSLSRHGKGSIGAKSSAGGAAEDTESGKSVALKRHMTVLHGACLIIGATIGSGIFTMPDLIIRAVGGVGTSLLIWSFGAVIAFAGAMVYGEWSCRVPQSGGDMPFLEAAYKSPPGLMPFLYSMSRVFFMNPGYIASQALTFAEYMAEIGGFSDYAKGQGVFYIYFFIAIFLVTLLASLCALSNRFGDKFFLGLTMLAIFTVLLISSVSLFILMNVFTPKPTGNFDENLFSISGMQVVKVTADDKKSEQLQLRKETSPFSKLGNLANGMIQGLWAYDGWSNLSAAAGEIANPQRTIKVANIVGLAIISLLYIGANISFLWAVPVAEFSGTLLSTFLQKLNFIGPTASRVLASGMVLITTCSCCFTAFFSAIRIAQATGESGQIIFADFFGTINKKTGTPLNAALVTWGLVLVFLFPRLFSANAFSMVVGAVSYLFWLFCALTVFGLLMVKKREGTLLKTKPNPNIGLQLHSSIPIILLVFISFMLIFSWLQFEEDSSGVAPWVTNLVALSIVVFSFSVFRWRLGASL